MKFGFLPFLFLFTYDAEAAVVPKAESYDYWSAFSGEENIRENFVEDDRKTEERNFLHAMNAGDHFKYGSGNEFGYAPFSPDASSFGMGNDNGALLSRGKNGTFPQEGENRDRLVDPAGDYVSKAAPPSATESETFISKAPKSSDQTAAPPVTVGFPSLSSEDDEELTSPNGTETDYGRGTVVNFTYFPERVDNFTGGNGSTAATKGPTVLSGLIESVWNWMKSSVAAIGTLLNHLLTRHGETSIVRPDADLPPSATTAAFTPVENTSVSYNIKIPSD